MRPKLKTKKFKLKTLKRLYRYSRLPKRILWLKRSKWTFLKNIVRKVSRYKRPKKVNNLNKIFTRYRFLNKLSKMYRNRLTKVQILKHYLNNRSKKLVVDKKSKRELQNINILKYLYSALNLLKYSHNSHTVYQGKDFMFRRRLYVNNNVILKNIFLSKGDLLRLDNSANRVSINKSTYTKSRTIYNFFEYDPYVKNVLVVKNSTEMTNNDISLSISQYINIETVI